MAGHAKSHKMESCCSAAVYGLNFFLFFFNRKKIIWVRTFETIGTVQTKKCCWEEMFLNSIYSNVYVVTVLFRTVQFSLHGSPVYCNWQPMGEPIWKCCWFCFSPPAMLPASSVCLAPLCLNGASESSAAAVCCMTLKSLESAELKGKMEDSKMLSCQLSVLTSSQISGVAACPFFLHT